MYNCRSIWFIWFGTFCQNSCTRNGGNHLQICKIWKMSSNAVVMRSVMKQWQKQNGVIQHIVRWDAEQLDCWTITSLCVVFVFLAWTISYMLSLTSKLSKWKLFILWRLIFIYVYKLKDAFTAIEFSYSVLWCLGHFYVPPGISS